MLLLLSPILLINLSLWDFSLRNSVLILTKVDGLLVFYLRILILLSSLFCTPISHIIRVGTSALEVIAPS